VKKKNENWLMRAYAREAKKLYVIGFYWSSFVLKNAANGRKKAANFDSIPPYFFDLLRGFLRVDCGEFARAGHGRFFRAGEMQNEGAERAQWICTAEKSCERIIFSNFASIRNRQLLLKIN